MNTRREDARDQNPGAGEQAGEGVGGIGGTVAGATLGSVAGPVGTLVGGIAGAVGGWWVGEKAGRALEDWGDHEPHYREHYDSSERGDIDWDDARVGYSVGHLAGRNPDYAGRDFTDIEADLRDNWDHDRDYIVLRPYVVTGYNRAVSYY
mgnify:CR=1 FL=1